MKYEFALDAPGTPSLFCGTPLDYQHYRARRVYGLARVMKKKRLGLTRATVRDDGGMNLEIEHFDGPVIPDLVDFYAAEYSSFHITDETAEWIQRVWADARPTGEVVESVMTESEFTMILNFEYGACPVCYPDDDPAEGEQVEALSFAISPSVDLTANQKLHILRHHRYPCDAHESHALLIDEFGQTYRWWSRARSWVEANAVDARGE